MPEITRIAPSPTGMAHIGTFRTAYINWLAARSTGGKFILRIDDTDIDRNKPEWTQLIFDSLDWLGLDYDEVHYQSKRTEIYAKAAQSLLQEKKAFVAPNNAIILNPPTAFPETFLDTIGGEIKVSDKAREQINDNLVLVRGGEKTGIPTYQFASVVDDYYLGVNRIIRGVDHINNTHKQLAIWNTLCEPENVEFLKLSQYKQCELALAYKWDYKEGIGVIFNGSLPQFTHIGLVFKDKKKLSKRDGAASLLEYKNQGYSSEAVLNWMLLMGWGLSVPRGNKELEKIAAGKIDKNLAIELFNRGTLKSSPCNYDIQKLNWFQKIYGKKR